ncbi:hypothetical protein D3C78_1695430 [compost metagenome]
MAYQHQGLARVPLQNLAQHPEAPGQYIRQTLATGDRRQIGRLQPGAMFVRPALPHLVVSQSLPLSIVGIGKTVEGERRAASRACNGLSRMDTARQRAGIDRIRLPAPGNP